MNWEVTLLVFLGGLAVLMLLGVPVAISFLTMSFLSSFLMFGERGIDQFVVGLPTSIAKFAMTPIPLFIFMGFVLYHSGLGSRALDAIDASLGDLPGRLGVLSMGGGALFGVLSGSSVANTTLLGSIMLPELRAKGYSKNLAVGPLLAAGPLAILFPPSAMIVLIGAIGNIPIGPMLIAGIAPGIILVILNCAYIIQRAARFPHEAPKYSFDRPSVWIRTRTLLLDVVPLTLVFVVVAGVILFGVATPTEAAAFGAAASTFLVFAYRATPRQTLAKALTSSVATSAMILFIIACAAGYSALLAFSGATRDLVSLVTEADVAPIVVVILMMLVLLVIGTMLEQVSILLLTIPFFVPIIVDLGYDPIWFGILMLLAIEIAGLTPPMGLTLYVMKGVAPPDISMGDVIRAAVPFLVIEIVVLAMLVAFPVLVLGFPGVS